MPKISFTITRARGDRRHFIDEDDVRFVLARLPVEVTSRCRVVHFNDRSRGGHTLGYTNRGRHDVAITALPPRISLSRFLVPPQRAETFGALKGAQWPPLAVRRFLLYEVLLHEIGHLQEIHASDRDERRRFAVEPRAEEFANAWRERLWTDPAEHDDPVHRAPSAEEIAALGTYREAHEEYRRGLSASDRKVARAHHARAVELFPGHALAQEDLGVSAWAHADGDNARRQVAAGHLRAALRVDPLLTRARFTLALTLFELGEVEEARRHLERARRWFTLSATGHALYANALADAGVLAAAERAFQRAIEKDPGRAATLIDHAWTILELSPPTDETAARALALFERAVALAPTSSRAHLCVAKALAELPAEATRAAHHAEEALRLGPGDEDAVALLARLRGSSGGQDSREAG